MPQRRERRRSRSRRRSPLGASAPSSSARPPREPPAAQDGDWLAPVSDQHLRELVVDLPLPVGQALVRLGEDIRCMWSTSESLMVELADFMHADLNEQTNGQIARLWSLARREGLRQREEAVKAVVVARQSSYRPRRAHGSERPPEPAEPPRRVKLVRDVGGPQPDRVVTTLAGQTAHTKEEHQKQVKLDSLFQLVTEHVLVVHLASLKKSLLQLWTRLTRASAVLCALGSHWTPSSVGADGGQWKDF